MRIRGVPSTHVLAWAWGGKETALLDLLRRNPVEKKLVFVHSRETLACLGDLLGRNNIVLRVSMGA
jgi:hypothetical protein